jgi:hypothetical protein
MSVKPKLLSATDDWKATYENQNRWLDKSWEWYGVSRGYH